MGTVALSVIILIIVAIALLVLLLLLLELRRRRPANGGGSTTGSGAGSTTGGTTIPNTLNGTEIGPLLAPRLAGVAADGSGTVPGAASQVVWVDRGDEVLVHLDSVATQISGQTVLVSIDLECDQTGRTPLIVAFALGDSDTAGLIVATDEYPRGNGLLASRWGTAVQAAAWSALLSLASDHASERSLEPLGLAVSGGQLHLHAGAPLRIA